MAELERDFRRSGGRLKKYRVGDLFEIKPTKKYALTKAELFAAEGCTPVVTNSAINNGVAGYSDLPPTENGGIITYSDTLTCKEIFYQPSEFIGYPHIQGLYPVKYEEKWNEKSLLFFATVFRKMAEGKFNYLNKFNRAVAAELTVELPARRNEPDFGFMERYIGEIEQERVSKLYAVLEQDFEGIKISDNENMAESSLSDREWRKFSLKELFGSSTRGRRLKSADRIEGELPFVTAGELNDGISAYINNDVRIFEKNTITVDMFGSAKYRDYIYGADDHIAVIHTENIGRNAGLFLTAAIHKASHTSFFSYSRNFYTRDADGLYIYLPVTKDGEADYIFMEEYIGRLIDRFIRISL